MITLCVLRGRCWCSVSPRAKFIDATLSVAPCAPILVPCVRVGVGLHSDPLDFSDDQLTVSNSGKAGSVALVGTALSQGVATWEFVLVSDDSSACVGVAIKPAQCTCCMVQATLRPWASPAPFRGAGL